MKEYHVKITRRAALDMEAVYRYIADELQAPENAMGQYNRIADAVLSLANMPSRCALVHFQPERSMGFRQLTVDNYLIVFVLDGDDATVIRILYGASDLAKRMHKER